MTDVGILDLFWLICKFAVALVLFWLAILAAVAIWRSVGFLFNAISVSPSAPRRSTSAPESAPEEEWHRQTILWNYYFAAAEADAEAKRLIALGINASRYNDEKTTRMFFCVGIRRHDSNEAMRVAGSPSARIVE